MAIIVGFSSSGASACNERLLSEQFGSRPFATVRNVKAVKNLAIKRRKEDKAQVGHQR